MAFNHSYQVDYPRQVSLDNSPLEASSSILSDSQSLWVLFNPSVHSQSGHESDILSFTNDTQIETESHSEEDSLSGWQATQEYSLSQHPTSEWTRLDVEWSNEQGVQSESDSLIDHLTGGEPTVMKTAVSKAKERHSRLLETPGSELHRRINKWRHNNIDEMVDDNTASWDLDEDLSLQLDPVEEDSSKKLFYGDDVLSSLSHDEYVNFKNVERNLRQSLGTHKDNSYLPYIINQILYKLAHSSQGPVQQPSLGTLKYELQKYSSLLKDNKTQPFLDSILESHLRNSHVSHAANTKHPSDTTSASSLILCGGSWNEL